MPEYRGSLGNRLLIMGNAGSGKSVLSQHLSRTLHLPLTDLDLLHWEDDGHGVKRDEAIAKSMTSEVASRPKWVIEGVYGWLVEVALPRATALLWLDMPWSVCREGLMTRGLRRGAVESDQTDLLKWAEAYWERKTPSSFTGHLALFEGFSGTKLKFSARAAVDAFVAGLARE